MFGFGTLMWLASIAMLIAGPITAFNCLRGLISREGMYDQEATTTMFWSQVVGIILGIGMAYVGFSYLTGGLGGSAGGCST
jgi:hypothetical protein